jgi:hypothetical protein
MTPADLSALAAWPALKAGYRANVAHDYRETAPDVVEIVPPVGPLTTFIERGAASWLIWREGGGVTVDSIWNGCLSFPTMEGALAAVAVSDAVSRDDGRAA